MAETKVEIHGIEKLEVKTGVKDVPVEGGEKGETERRLITAVKFEYEGAGGQFDKIMLALAAEHVVDVIIASPQRNLGIDSVTLSSGKESVTLDKEFANHLEKAMGK